jgi:hypothetical protein
MKLKSCSGSIIVLQSTSGIPYEIETQLLSGICLSRYMHSSLVSVCNCVRYVLDHGNAAADAPALDCTPESEFFWPRRAFANECISLARNALFPSALTPVKLCKKCSARVRKCSERFARCASATRNSSPLGEMCIMQQRDIIAFYC